MSILCIDNITNEGLLKAFLLSKDSSTGHSKREKKKRSTKEEIGRQY